MAMVTDPTRIPPITRAAIALIVCAELVCCGCRAPWRSWRNDEPSLEQLLVHPEPWDAEARIAQESPTHRNGLPPNSDKAIGRPNPYASRGSAAASRALDAEADSRELLSRAEEASQAEFEAAYAAAPPHLRELLKRQWEAAQAHNVPQSGGDYDAAAEAYAATDEYAPARVPISRRSRSADEPVAHRMARAASRTADRDRSERDRLERDDERFVDDREYLAESDRSEEESTVIYSLSDTDPEEPAELAIERNTRPHELAPPPRKKASRQVAHAEPIDTGAGDDVLVKPSATSSHRDPKATSAAASKSPPKSARPQQPGSYVTTASAEVAAGPELAVAASVAPAVAEEKEIAPAAEMDWRQHVREALRQLEDESGSATDSPVEQLHRQASTRMLRLTLGELESALKPIEGLQSHEQEFFRHELQALYDAIDLKGNPVLSRRWTLALDSHRKAMAHLAAVSNLEIKNASFCTDVHSYGVVSRFPNPHFKPNQELLLYCELDNFSAEAVKDGYETQLQGSYEIVDAGGRRIADMLLPEDADVCRNQRRDYFIAYRIYMPQKIEPGRYQLRLTIEDMKGRKFGQTSLDFQIAP